jgi:hypothetical protein
MDFIDFTHYFSAPRVNRYLAASNLSEGKAIELYKANLKIAQAFHPLIGIFEVVLRNRINAVLAIHFNDPDWILHQKMGFMIDPSLQYTYKRTGLIKTNDFLLREINKAEKRIQKTRTPITSGRIIAEQTLGFWSDLFERHHYRLLKGKPIQIFHYLPSSYGRKEVNDELNKVRRFRNRMNHNEPICFRGNTIDFTETLEVHQSILNVLNWIDPKLIQLILPVDKVNSEIEKAKTI